MTAELASYQIKADQLFFKATESTVDLVSKGRILVISDRLSELERYIGKSFPENSTLQFVFMSDGAKSTKLIEVLSPQLNLSGGFSQFILRDSNKTFYADIIIDLCQLRILAKDQLGYLYYPDDHMIGALDQLIGEFEKPVYLNINSDICAFGNGHLKGCRQCLDACEVSAISLKGNQIAISHDLCQGNGDCTVVCPSGAMTYQFLQTDYLLGSLQNLLKESIADGIYPTLVFVPIGYSADDSQLELESPLYIQLESVGIIDVASLLLLLCYGARAIFIIDRQPNALVDKTILQTNYLLEILGYMPAIQSQKVTFDKIIRLKQVPFKNKRDNFFLAIDYLFLQTNLEPCTLDLSKDYCLGKVQIDSDRCTLCFSCVTVCPAKALLDKKGEPTILFKEENCLQCGLCEDACPESAIDLHAQLELDVRERRAYQVLHQDPPAYCQKCQKPFATQKMLQMIEKKLKSNSHYQNNQQQLDSIYLCADCKVIALVEES